MIVLVICALLYGAYYVLKEANTPKINIGGCELKIEEGSQLDYLIDSGVAGSEKLVADYMQSIGRQITDIQGIFLTHAHPDHIGAAAEIKRRSGCEIFAPAKGLSWIENIERQFAERPIPNFFHLLSESVHVDHPLFGEEVVECEQHITLQAMATPGHSDDSLSYILNDRVMFITVNS